MRPRLFAGLIAISQLMSVGQAVAAVPLPEPLPPPCDAGAGDWLRALLKDLYADLPSMTATSSLGGQCPDLPVCYSTTELTATVTDGHAKQALDKFDGIAAERFGNSLFIDVAGLKARIPTLVSVLCTIRPLVSNLRLSVGPPLNQTAPTVAHSQHDNADWRRVIEAPPACEVKPSRLKVAVIDGDVLTDHEDLPTIDRYRVVGLVMADGDCKNGSCCESYLKKGSYPSTNHAAWTIGTIAAKPNNGLGIDGLSIPAAIISIDQTERDCPTMWRLASAMACAVERGANVIHYSAEPVGGADMQALFKPVVDRAVKADALMVFPSGNKSLNLDKCPAWPNAFNDHALTVGQFERSGGTGSMVGYGAGTVDLGLPLGDVYTTENCGSACYGSYGQTSAASAIVTGSVLQMSGHDNFQNCTAPQLGELLMSYAVPPSHPDVRRNVSPSGGQLNLHFLKTVVRDANGNAVDYCMPTP